MNKDKTNNGIRIISIQMGSFYDFEFHKRKYLDIGKATLDYSLFSEHMLENGINVNKKNKTLDFIMCSFDYGSQHDKNMTASVIRDYYYNNEFTINWNNYYDINRKSDSNIVTYKRLCRSTGKAKEGDCLFINKQFCDIAEQYINLGIKLENNNSKLVELSAYNTLTFARMLNSIRLPLNRILILKDQEIETMANAVIVKTKKVNKEISELDFRTMELYANNKGYTFYKKNEYRNTGYELITDKKIDSLIDLLGEDNIIRDENKRINYKATEINANRINRTFYKSKSNKLDGYILIERTLEAAIERDIEVIYKKVDIQECYVDRPNKPVKVKNIMWDGMGLVDHSVMPEGCKDYIYVRNHMTKVCLFDAELVQYLKDYCVKNNKDYNTATITDMYGEKKISDILAVITDKALKWTKFNMTYEEYDEILAKYDYKFAIVKTGHNSKYGDLQRMSYQGCNSIPCLDENDLINIAQTSIDYANDLKLDDKKFIEYLDATKNIYNVNSFFVNLYKQNNNLFKYDYFAKERNSIISRFKRERLELGKLMQNGDNLTICGNPYALLLYATGQDWKSDPTLNRIGSGIQCYTKRFNHGEELAGYRSPHNSPNNYGYYINYHHPLMEKYFPNLGDTVICINMIETDNQARLNGHDLDTDGIYCTNQPTIVKYSKLCYETYHTIINDVPPVDSLSEEDKKDYKITSYGNDLSSYAKMDNFISKYQYGIGQSSNIAQLALSYYYDKLYRTGKKDEDLEDVFIISSVLAQLYIDSAKKSFAIDLNREMRRLTTLDCMQLDKKYPKFYAEIQKQKNKVCSSDSDKKKKGKEEKLSDIERNTIDDCKCPMDMLATIINSKIVDKRGKGKNKTYPISNLLIDAKDINKRKIDGKQSEKVQKIIIEYDKKIKNLNLSDKNYNEQANEVTEETLEELKNITINKETMYRLIRIAFGLEKGISNNKHIRNRLLIMLYNYDKKNDYKTFLGLFKKIQQKSLEVA